MKYLKFFLCFLILLATVYSNSTFGQKIGILMDSYVVDRWTIDEKLLSDRITELGGEYIIEVAHGDADMQTKLARKLIDEGVKALLVVATDAKKSLEIADLCKASKVPMIAYDRLILSENVSLCISYNNQKVGELQAGTATKNIKKGNFLLINGPVSDQNAVEFRNGQLKVLEPLVKKGEVNIIGDIVLDSWGELQSFLALEEFTSSNKEKIDCIIAANDAVASGAISVLGEKSGIYVTGQDADLTGIVNIVKGSQGMTVYKPIKPIAYAAAEAAIRLARGEELSNAKVVAFGDLKINSILLDPIVVDKTNFRETVIKDGHVELSEIMER